MAKIDYSKQGFAKSLNKTMEKSGMTGNAVTAVDLRLDKIDENPDNRQIFNMEEVERLAHTIDEDGFSGAIEVYQKDDGRYEISAGHRRYNAMKLLGKDTIPAIIKPMPDVVTKRKKLVKSNIHNRNMYPMDWARSIDYARETYYMQDAQERGIAYPPSDGKRYYPKLNVMELLEEDFGMKRAQISKYLSLLSLIPEMIQMIEEGKVVWSALVGMSNETVEVQKKIYEGLAELYDNGPDDEDGKKVPLSKNQVELVTKKYRKRVEQPVPPSPKTVEEKIDTVIPTYDSEKVVVSDEPEIEEKAKEEPLMFETDVPAANVSYIQPQPEVVPHVDAPRTNAPVVYMDTAIQNISSQFDALLNADYPVKDKKSVKNTVDKLRKILDKIEADM